MHKKKYDENMKPVDKYIVVCIVLLLGLISCTKDDVNTSIQGTIRVGVNLDTSVKTKADEGPIRLTIVKADDKGNPVPGAPVYGYDLPTGPISLPADTYLLTAFTGENLNGRPTSKPYYVGSKKETIAAGDDKTISIECKLTTAVIAINYDGLGAYKGLEYETVVGYSENSADNITFSSTNNIRKGYFVPGTELSVVFRYRGEDKIWKDENMPKIVGTKAQYQYNIKFTVREDDSEGDTGSAGVGIEVTYPSEKPNNVDIQIKIPFATDDVKIITKTNGAEIKGSFLTNTSTVVDKATFKYKQKGTTNWISETLSDKLEGEIFGLQSGQSYDYEYKGLSKTPIIGNFITTPEVEVNAWAKFALLAETYSCASDDIASLKIQYRIKDTQEWSLPQENILDNSILKLTGLKSKQNYEYKFISSDGKIESEIYELTTDDMLTIPNLNFDDWFKDAKTWYPWINVEESKYWDSGNKGANTLNEVNPTVPEDSDVHSGRAAKLASKKAAGQFAAGNIYTGKFLSATFIPLGAKLEFGKSYSGRPTQMKGWFKYNPGKITHTKKDFIKKEDQDSCSIYIALTSWDEPFEVSTGDNKFINFDSPEIIAYGELDMDRCSPASMSAYEPFVINLKYRDMVTKPKHILIVASASRYGDYFTGSTNSVLLVDDFEFSFDYNSDIK